MNKPVLIGMNNPYGVDPYYALYPLPEGATGWRIWQMLEEETGCTMRQYRDAFDRYNVCIGPWDLGRARARAADLRREIAGRTVVLLGSSVRDAFGHLAVTDVSSPYRTAQDGPDVVFYQLPHPSGRNRWYNDEANRNQAKQVLGSLYRRASREVSK